MGLLKGIDPLLTADILHILRSMGHGDKLALVDCNFPAMATSKETTSGKHIILTVPLPEAINAICSVLPLDFFEEKQAMYMAPQEGVELPAEGEEVHNQMRIAIHKHCGECQIKPIERFSFYEEANKCFAVVQTMERRPYGNVILIKGCVGPDENDLRP